MTLALTECQPIPALCVETVGGDSVQPLRVEAPRPADADQGRVEEGGL